MWKCLGRNQHLKILCWEGALYARCAVVVVLIASTEEEETLLVL